MEKKKRSIALFLFVIIVFALSFSIAYIAAEADHICSGQGCAICHEMQACANFLHGAGTALTTVTVSACVVYFLLTAPRCIPAPRHAATLVSLKVRLSN